jgi:exopolysaccharide biosynthesis polyprenyl glycosylphosphotransferase
VPTRAFSQQIPDISSLIRTVQANAIQDVIFIHHPALEAISPKQRQDILVQLMAYPVRIWIAFDIEDELPALVKNHSNHYRVVPLITEELVTSQNATKRAFDLVIATALLVVLLPILAGIAIMVRLSSPGPIIFRQMRTGAHGHQFNVMKFRTMVYDREASFQQATPGDPRITGIGRFLRKTSLDESLQLLNVIKGDMSLVGPRPHAPETQVEGVTFENALKMYRLRYRVKPGLTGLAQIRGQRGQTEALEALERRLASDLEYIESWSILTDLMILFRTIPAVFNQTNAY